MTHLHSMSTLFYSTPTSMSHSPTQSTYTATYAMLSILWGFSCPTPATILPCHQFSNWNLIALVTHLARVLLCNRQGSFPSLWCRSKWSETLRDPLVWLIALTAQRWSALLSQLHQQVKYKKWNLNPHMKTRQTLVNNLHTSMTETVNSKFLNHFSTFELLTIQRYSYSDISVISIYWICSSLKAIAIKSHISVGVLMWLMVSYSIYNF